jgi:hypothetical protein
MDTVPGQSVFVVHARGVLIRIWPPANAHAFGFLLSTKVKLSVVHSRIAASAFTA